MSTSYELQAHAAGRRLMKTLRIAIPAAIWLVAVSPLRAAENWVGAWAYAVAPLPPGEAPVVVAPAAARLSALTPLTAPPAPATRPPFTAPQPLLENPGHLEILPASVNLTNTTVRQLVRVSAGGSQVRLRFSNEDGADVMLVGAAHVAEAGPDGSIVPGTDRPVTFDGQPGVAIPASSPLLSDPVSLSVKPLDRLLISVYVPGPVPKGGRSLYMYVTSTPGDHTAAASLPDARLARVTMFVSEVEVNTEAPTNVIVALGDSITEGAASTANAFRGWPDRLAERLVAAHKNWAVVNAGIGGNRLLRYGTGPSALARFDRDVLSVPGIKAIILLEGINDIGRGFSSAGPTEPVTAEALEAADRQIIARAHEKGIKVYGALLTPYEGAGYASPAGEAVREALNGWIRTSGSFDGVIDLATPVADPANPLTFAHQFNDRDHLHPNDAGYQAMANAIDLDMITK
jgi:lysophospholipase L1-like esterase